MKLNLSQLLPLDLQLLKKIKSSFCLPVLIQEVLVNLELNPKEPQCFVDCNLGAGGDSKHILGFSI